MTSYLKKLVIISITIGLCLSILEIGLRVLGRIPSNMTDGFFTKYGNSYRLKRNIRKIVNWPSYSYVAYTNSLGFRDSRTGERNLDSKPYVIFLGGSDAFGNGVNYEDSFVGIFAEAASKRNMDILNMAVGGHFFEDQMTLFLDSMDKFSRKPSTVVLCINPTIMSMFDRDHRYIIVKGGYLFRKQSWILAYIRLRIGNLSSAYCFFRDNLRKLSGKWTNYSSKVSEGFISAFHKNNRMFDPEVVMQLEDRLDRFDKHCRENDIKFVLLYLPLIDSFGLRELLIRLDKNPDDYDTSHYGEIVKRYCRKRNLKLINAEPVLRSHYDRGIQLRFVFDSHYNKDANRVVGTYLIGEMFSGMECTPKTGQNMLE